jgi:hypothetical protein
MHEKPKQTCANTGSASPKPLRPSKIRYQLPSLIRIILRTRKGSSRLGVRGNITLWSSLMSSAAIPFASSALDPPAVGNGICMKKASNTTKRASSSEEMRPEYDFSRGVRGKYSARFAEGTNLVLLAPDVAAEFPTATAVNKALRDVIKARSKRRRTA